MMAKIKDSKSEKNEGYILIGSVIVAILLSIYNFEYVYGIEIYLTSAVLFFILKEFGSKRAFQASLIVYLVSSILGENHFTNIILPLQFFFLYYIFIKRKSKVNLLLADIMFWVILGGPINFIMYYLGNKGLDFSILFPIFEVFKEITVDLMNLLVIDLCFTYIPLVKRRRRNENTSLSIKEFSVHLLMIALSIPFLINICFYNVIEQKNQVAKAQEVANKIIVALKDEFNGEKKDDGKGSTKDSEKWSELDFQLLGLNDPLQKKKIETILERLSEFDSELYSVIITDSENKTIFRSDDISNQKDAFKKKYDNEDILEESGQIIKPKREKTYFKATEWAGGDYICKNTLYKDEDYGTLKNKEVNLVIYVEMNMKAFQEKMIVENLKQFVTLVIFSIFLIVAAIFINKNIFKNISNLAQITLDIPNEINVAEKIKWPTSTVFELNILIENFKNMTLKLKDMFDKSNLLDEKLNMSMEKLHEMAYYDNLTGLGNRHNFKEFLGYIISSSEYKKTSVGVMFIDMDHFKEINDFLGHATGDVLLQKISERLKGLKKTNLEIFRLGGDEFVIVIISNDEDEIRGVGEAIISRFHEPFLLKGGKYTLTGSIGVSMYPKDGDDIETITKYADMAMYRCKENGGDYVQFFNEDIKTSFLESVAIENGIRKGLNEREFRLVFQPKIDIDKKKVGGVEALLRWQSKELGFIPPDKFIPLAEESELIVDIDRWVLREACKKNKEIQDLGLGRFPVSVNISPIHFTKGDLLFYVKMALRESGLEARYLKLEITEGVFIHNNQDVINIIIELNKIGVLVSIDDFGKGYSSLNEIMTLPVKEVKIDRYFVRDIFKDSKREMVVRLIVELAHGFNLKVVAEGVENIEELESIVETGCDEIQGYFFSRPLELKDLKRYLSTQGNKFECLMHLKRSGEDEKKNK